MAHRPGLRRGGRVRTVSCGFRTVDIGNGETGAISVREDDDPAVLARDFASVYVHARLKNSQYKRASTRHVAGTV